MLKKNVIGAFILTTILVAGAFVIFDESSVDFLKSAEKFGFRTSSADPRRQRTQHETALPVPTTFTSKHEDTPAKLRGLTLVAQDDSVVIGSSILLFSNDEISGEYFTDRSGWIDVDVAKEMFALVKVPNRLSFVVTVKPATEKIVLPDHTGELAGKLRVDGSPAPSGIVLKLRSDGCFLFPDGLPKSLRSQPSERLESILTNETTTDQRGCFSFLGISSEWQSGTLCLPDCLSIVRDSFRNEIRVPRPTRSLEIESYFAPVVVGRCVNSESAEGIAGCSIRMPDISSDVSVTDLNGDFRVASISKTVANPVKCEVTFRGYSESMSVYFDPPMPYSHIKLCDIRIQCANTIRIRAVDSSGNYVKRFFASMVGSNDLFCSESSGTLTFRSLPPGKFDVDVCASPYRIARIQLSPGEGLSRDTETVEFRCGGRLTIMAQDKDGSPVKNRILQIKSDRPLFGSDQVFPPRCAIEAYGSPIISGAREAEGCVIRVKTDESGAVVIGAVEPGVVLTVFGDPSWDPSGCFRSSPVSLSDDNDRVVTLVIDQRLMRHFDGQLMTRSSSPVKGARITLWSSDGHPLAGTKSDSAGRFGFSNIAAESAVIQISSPGCASIRKEIVLQAGDSPSEIIYLDSEVDVDIVLVDAEGKIVKEKHQVLVHNDGRFQRTEYVEPGRYRYSGMSAASLDVSISVGGGMKHETLAVVNNQCRFVVPSLGAIRIELSGDEGCQSYRVRLMNESGEKSEIIFSKDEIQDSGFEFVALPGTYYIYRDYWRPDDSGKFRWVGDEAAQKVVVVQGATQSAR